MTFYEKHIDPRSQMHWNGNMQADYIYTSGVSGDKFFKHIMKNNTFLAAKCSKCNKIFFPPRIYCEDCFCEINDNDWIEIPAKGKVNVYTIVTIDTYGLRLKDPKIIGLIDIDQTDGSILGIIETDDLNEDLQGLEVEAIFKPEKDREGFFKDIQFFKKIK